MPVTLKKIVLNLQRS